MYNVLMRYDHALRSSSRPRCVLQEEGLERIICYASARGALQQIGGEPLNAEAGERVFRVSMIVGLTTARGP